MRHPTTTMIVRHGALTARLTVRDRTADVQLDGRADSIDHDDDEAIDEIRAGEEVIEQAVRSGARRIRVRINAAIDAGSTLRLGERMLTANRRGVLTSMRTADDSTRRTTTAPHVIWLPKSFPDWERLLFRTGLLVSGLIAWIRFLQYKWQ